MKFCTLLFCCCCVAVVTTQNVNGQSQTSRKKPTVHTQNQRQRNPSPNYGNNHKNSQSTPETQNQNHQSVSPVKFSADLFEAVKESEPQNFVLSPLILRNGLAMLSLGARGETAEEIQKVLQLPANARELIDRQSNLISSLKEISSATSGVQFVTADKIYANSGLRVKTSFKNNVKQIEGEIENLDFSKGEETAEKINSWVRSKTAGKIEKIVESSALNSQTSLLLLNTIYFKGFWKNQFSPSSTRKRQFFIDGKKNVSVEMMLQENEFHYAFLQEPNAQVINLPYKGERLSMMIYVPNEGGSLSRLENWIKNKSSFEIQKQHFTKREKVSVFLPKFKIRSSLQLNEPLKSLGLKKMFDTKSANFSGIFNGPESFFVSKVSQETFIEVNEEGTEAAAVTGYEVSATSFGSQFKVDRPFVFQILDSSTETVLFTGRVKDPRNSQEEQISSTGSSISDYHYDSDSNYDEAEKESSEAKSNSPKAPEHVPSKDTEGEEKKTSCDPNQNVDEILQELLSFSNPASSQYAEIPVSCLKLLVEKRKEEKAAGVNTFQQTLPQFQSKIKPGMGTEAQTPVVTKTTTTMEKTPEPEVQRYQEHQYHFMSNPTDWTRFV